MLGNIITKITAKISGSQNSDTESKSESESETSKSIFKLPIEYLDESQRFILQETVADDLELSSKLTEDMSNNTVEPSKTMYHYLLNPKNEFAQQMIPKWRTYITTNSEFLVETQEVIQAVGQINTFENQKAVEYPQIMDYKPDYDKIMTIWRDTKEDPNFLERYSYMEMSMFKSLNKIPTFLQAISIVNMGSPILSFLIPFILFLFPFVILKIQGIPITFSIYMSVLKEISRNHFIGKLISNAQNMSLQNVIYMFTLLGLYAYQIYQNYTSCVRFYKNINRINEQICEMQKYVKYNILRMEQFSTIIKTKSQYRLFHVDLLSHIETLKHLRQRIQNVRPFTPSFSKIGEIGLLLGCYYELYSNIEYENALKYSFDFIGFTSNLLGISENLDAKKLGISEFYMDLSGNSLAISDQYYPALIDETYVSNDVEMDRNMIITGPNAAGKTTYLKTTIINIIFTQQFGCGFYSACKMKPYTHIHSYLNIPDTSGRDSLFQAESRRCKEILNVISDSNEKSRHFGIFDELYSGTNPAEATKSAYSFLLYLSKFENVEYILTTHYVDICSRLTKASTRIENWKMDATMDEKLDIHYHYTISRGISKIQGAIKVLRDMEYPEEIIHTIMEYDNKLVEEAEEPKLEEPKTEEPKTEEPKTEEPKTEEPKTEEPKNEEPKTEETKPIETKKPRRSKK